MASYGVFIAATGFHCHADQGLLRFAPKIGAKDFAGPFVGAGAWGRFAQKQEGEGLSARVEVRFGALRLARLELTPPGGQASTTSVSLAGKPLEHSVEIREGRVAILLKDPVTLNPGQALEVRV